MHNYGSEKLDDPYKSMKKLLNAYYRCHRVTVYRQYCTLNHTHQQVWIQFE